MIKRHVRFAFCFFWAVAAATTAASRPTQIVEKQTDAGTYVLIANERSLYWNEKEASQAEITCLDQCLESWMPFEAMPSQSGSGVWSIIPRPDGIRQWAYAGKPIYTFVGDTFPGARLGDGASQGAWQLLFEFRDIPAVMKIEPTILGYVLADHDGQTLYFRKGSSNETLGVDYAIDKPWRPFEAPRLALDQGDWTTQPLDGATRQWAYKGKRLYTFAKDVDPYDVHGHGVGDIWSAVILEKAPALPTWMTVQWTDIGLAYADADGLTLYAPRHIGRIRSAQTCPEDCMKENWRTVLAKPGEKSSGNWIIRENDNGQRQWSYKGKFVYTHKKDQGPGDIKGNGIGVGYRIGDGWRLIPFEPVFRRSSS